MERVKHNLGRGSHLRAGAEHRGTKQKLLTKEKHFAAGRKETEAGRRTRNQESSEPGRPARHPCSCPLKTVPD